MGQGPRISFPPSPHPHSTRAGPEPTSGTARQDQIHLAPRVIRQQNKAGTVRPAACENHRAMTTNRQQPTVYLIAGPNGAGKTTFATQFLPNFVKCREFLNADLIAAGLSPFAPETQNMRAGRLLIERIRELAKARRDFGFETTLAGRMHLKLIEDLRKWDYRIDLFFLWLPSARRRRPPGGRARLGGRAPCARRSCEAAAMPREYGTFLACIARE